MKTCIVVMGVSGCGKSSAGRRLAERLGAQFVEGDDLHPPANVEKMRAGIALDDDDRAPWLVKVGETLAKASSETGLVIACSALKRAYRDLLRQHAGSDLRFIHLTGSRTLLAERMANRPGHYMPVSLLDSQLSTLEPTTDENDVIDIDCALTPAAIEQASLAFLATNRRSDA
ncbi:gluconokinase [Martelella alba]|uniref:Gluconokinase n=1 Tax=Martelella alba TaxID=2590451 RepID=A0A506U9I2_9HYPH|nr:gluconokinase [Martelella alba]TPW30016.1 gluconokinase [Martelella alba]